MHQLNVTRISYTLVLSQTSARNRSLLTSLSVDNPAVLADLPFRARERDVPHLDHGTDEIVEEFIRVVAVGLHEILCVGNAFRAGKEALVGGQEAPIVQEVLVVVVVEHVGGADIEGGGLVAVTACAEALQAVGKAGIKRRID